MADGGYRSGDSSDSNTTVETGECIAQESTVYELVVGWDDANDLPDVVEFFDTDDADRSITDNQPDWAMDASLTATPYVASPYGCIGGGDGSEVIGNLVQSNWWGNVISSLATISIDPLGEYLVAFYPVTASTRNFGCVRGFRALVSEFQDGASPWEPLQEWTYGELNGSMPGHSAGIDGDAAARRANVDPGMGWFRDEPMLETWAPNGAIDSIFVSYDDGLLVSSLEAWYAPAEDTSGFGWDSAYADLDEMRWIHAFDDGLVLQDNGVDAVAACHGCDASAGDRYDVVFDALDDIGAAVTYADGDLPGYRECAWNNLGSTAHDASWYQDDTGDVRQLWVITETQGSEHDDLGHRAILLDDGTNGFCWDTITNAGRTNFMYQDGAGGWWQACADEDITGPGAWPACDLDGSGGSLSTSPFEMEVMDVGVPRKILALSEDFALLVTDVGCIDGHLDSGNNFVCDAEGGEGLWVVEHDTSNGSLSYRPVWYDDPTTCTSAMMFDGSSGINSITDIAVDPKSPAYDSGTGLTRVTAYLTSRFCEPRKVTFDLGYEGLSSHVAWSDIPISTACNVSILSGVAVSPNGTDLMYYGGTPDTSGSSTGGILCAVDASTGAATKVVTHGDVTAGVRAVLPHPHVDGLWFFGVQTADYCTTGCSVPGLFALQKRYNPASPSTPAWSYGRITKDDLEQPQVQSLEWGAPTAASGSWQDVMRHVYFGSGGGGPWDVTLSW